jgi:hypothetical protein
MNASGTQTKQRRIEDLTQREIDMVYSLVRIGEWADSEISRVYKLSVDDVHEVFDNYIQLREAVLRNPPRDVLPQAPEPALTTKTPRKRRCDAVYATAKERQAAYRRRLQESRRAGIEQPLPANETDTSIPAVEEPSITVCEVPAPETGPENADPQHSVCDRSLAKGHDISESVPLPVRPEACSETQALRLPAE